MAQLQKLEGAELEAAIMHARTATALGRIAIGEFYEALRRVEADLGVVLARATQEG